jgi:hypothetical protein
VWLKSTILPLGMLMVLFILIVPFFFMYYNCSELERLKPHLRG